MSERVALTNSWLGAGFGMSTASIETVLPAPKFICEVVVGIREFDPRMRSQLDLAHLVNASGSNCPRLCQSPSDPSVPKSDELPATV